MLVKKINHPDANIYVQHLGKKFVCKDVFLHTSIGWSRIDIFFTKRFKKINIKLCNNTLLVTADTYSFHFINAKLIVDESDLLEYLIA